MQTLMALLLTLGFSLYLLGSLMYLYDLVVWNGEACSSWSKWQHAAVLPAKWIFMTGTKIAVYESKERRDERAFEEWYQSQLVVVAPVDSGDGGRAEPRLGVARVNGPLPDNWRRDLRRLRDRYMEDA